MRDPRRERSIDKKSAPLGALGSQAILRESWMASDGVSAAVIGCIVALVTSLGVSIACVAYLR